MGNCEARINEMREDDVESYGWMDREESDNTSDHSDDEITGGETQTKPTKNRKNLLAVETNLPSTTQAEESSNQASKSDLKLGKSVSAGNPFAKNGQPNSAGLKRGDGNSPTQRSSLSLRARAASDDKKWVMGADGTLVLQDVPPSPHKKENIIERNRNSVSSTRRRGSVDKPEVSQGKAAESIYKKEKEEKDKASKDAYEKKNNKRKNIHYQDKRGGYTYSNKNLVEVEKFLPPEIIESPHPDTVVFEGNLLKYKPGNGFYWVERYCVLTKTEFRYYKKQYQAYCTDIKPLVTVPIAEFLATFRVNLDLPFFSKKKGYFSSEYKSYQDLFQFEIFNELTDYPYHQEILNKTEDAEEQNQHQELNVEHLEGFKLWKQYEDEKRNKHGSPTKVKKGYLMRPPMTNKNFKAHPHEKQGLDKSRDGLSTRGSHQNTYPNNYSPPRLNPDGTLNLSPSKKPSPTKKAVYKWHKDQADMNSWTNREREWYYSEKRLLFAANKQEDRERWIAALNWIVDQNDLDSSRRY